MKAGLVQTSNFLGRGHCSYLDPQTTLTLCVFLMLLQHSGTFPSFVY